MTARQTSAAAAISVVRWEEEVMGTDYLTRRASREHEVHGGRATKEGWLPVSPVLLVVESLF